MAMDNHTERRQISLGFTPELFPEGTHICYLYSDEPERQRFMSEYVSSGINAREYVTYLADTTPDMVGTAVEMAGISVPSAQEQAQFNAVSAVQTCCPGCRFVPETMLDRLREMYTKQPAGCAGARMTAEMTWALHDIPGLDRLVEFEGRINDLVKIYPLTALCQYDTRKFDGATIFELLNVHPMMIVHGQIMRNPFYVAPAQHSGSKNGDRADQ